MTRDALITHIREKNSYLCVGLDTDIAKLPASIQQDNDAVFSFNKRIIDATSNFCVAYKFNTAFYEAMGAKGWEILERTVRYIPSTHFKIADAKRGDIGNTSSQYARAFFETIPFDAITVAPYMGSDSVRPFLEYKDKWTIVLGLTSNSGATDFEMVKTGGKYLYEHVLETAMRWGSPDNLMFVIGATQAESFESVRKLVPDHFYLVPGIGAQGGSLKEVSEKAMNNDVGLLVNVSRAIIYASPKEDFDTEAGIIAQQYQYEMKRYLSTKE
ncbi:MAG TPA: orotidine-5'-phosphate decarboxylase [Flavitalea sp.]|nr:orotidine-5'-phosphate decarboxylase [Flavitalea sp.]